MIEVEAQATAQNTMEPQSFARASISLVVPRLPGFLRSAVPTSISSFTKVDTAASQSRPVSSGGESSDARPPTPPPSYSETVSAFLTPMRLARKLPGLSSREASVETTIEEEDTIQWKYANQGISLLTLSASESTPSNAAGPSSPFARQLYVHGLTYLLRALPSTLTEEENSSLVAALPPSLGPTTIYASCDSIDEFPEYAEDHPVQGRTILQRIAAAVTVKLFVLASLLIPWAQCLFARAIRFNREYRLSERLFASTWTTADILSRFTGTLLASIWTLQDGRLARLLEALASWLITSLSAGVYDGVGEGMAVIGLRNDGQPGRPGVSVSHHHGGYHHNQPHHHHQQMYYGPPSAPSSPRIGSSSSSSSASRARAGSLRVQPAVAGIRARELRKARSHDAMRASASASGSGPSSPAKRGTRRSAGSTRCQQW